MLNTLSAVPTMRVRSADLAVDDPDLRRDLMAAFERVLDHGMLMHGPEVEEFERRFAIQKRRALQYSRPYSAGIGRG